MLLPGSGQLLVRIIDLNEPSSRLAPLTADRTVQIVRGLDLIFASVTDRPFWKAGDSDGETGLYWRLRGAELGSLNLLFDVQYLVDGLEAVGGNKAVEGIAVLIAIVAGVGQTISQLASFFRSLADVRDGGADKRLLQHRFKELNPGDQMALLMLHEALGDARKIELVTLEARAEIHGPTLVDAVLGDRARVAWLERRQADVVAQAGEFLELRSGYSTYIGQVTDRTFLSWVEKEGINLVGMRLRYESDVAGEDGRVVIEKVIALMSRGDIQVYNRK